MVHEVAVSFMLLPSEAHHRIKEVGRQGSALLGGQSTTSQCPLANDSTLLSFLSQLSAPGKKGDADLLFQLLVCVPFVAELTWLSFPSEVIAYLSLPYKNLLSKELTSTCSLFLS